MKEKLLEEIIGVYDELIEYTFVIHRGNKKPIIIKFKSENFYHLLGLHKMNLKVYFPIYVKTKNEMYQYIKRNISKFNNIIENHLIDNESLELRVKSFCRVIDMFNSSISTTLYDIREKSPTSLYDGEYALSKKYDDINCLLGLKISNESDDNILCAPQSWMPNPRVSNLIRYKRPLYIESIEAIPNKDYSTITN